MATEVPRYSDSIYKRLPARGLRRDVPEYTEVDYKKSVPISNRVCAGIKVHYSNIPVDCYCPKYGYFEQKVIVGRTLIFIDKKTLTYTKSRQRNAFNHFWDVSEKPYIPLADRVKEKEASESNDIVARGQNENNVKVKNESVKNPKSKLEKPVASVKESDDAHAEACVTTQMDDQDQHSAGLHSVLKSKDEPMYTYYVDVNRSSLMIQPYAACCARATDLVKHMRLSMSNKEEIVCDTIVLGKPEIFISSYIVTIDFPFWLPTADTYVENTENESEGNLEIQSYHACCARATGLIKHMLLSMSNREEIVCDTIVLGNPEIFISSYIVTADLPFWQPTGDIYTYVDKTGDVSKTNGVIQPYYACCARATDIVKHMLLSISNREGIVGDNTHVEKAEDDSERNLNTATFQKGDFENTHTYHETPKYGHENGTLDNDATFENESQLEDSAVNFEKLEQDYNTDFVTGILGVYARGQEHFNIENILTNNDHDDDDNDEDGHDFMSGLFGVYARD